MAQLANIYGFSTEIGARTHVQINAIKNKIFHKVMKLKRTRHEY